MATLQINDILTELRVENQRLSHQLLFANRCLTFLERYRNNLLEFCSKCRCNHLNDQKLAFNSLQTEYQCFVNHLINNQTEQQISDIFNIKQEFDDNDVNNECDNYCADVVEPNNNNVYTDIYEDNSTEDYSMNNGSDITDNNAINHFNSSELTNADDVVSQKNKCKNKRNITYKPVNNELRKLVVKACDDGENFRNVARIFQLKYATVRSIFNVWKKEGRNFKKKPISFRPKILTDFEGKQIREWYDENCCLLLREAKQMCLKTFGKRVSLTTILRTLHDLHYTFKLMPPIVQIINDFESVSLRYNYAQTFNEMLANKEKIFFVEELSVTLYTRASHGGTLKGSKTCKSVRSRNYSLKCVLNYDTLYLFEIEYKSNDNFFEEFLEKLLERFESNKPNRIENAILIMDSFKLSNTSEITNTIRSHGHKPVFMPPNSPFLGAIQCVYSEWKSFIKSSPKKDENYLYSIVINSADKFSSLSRNFLMTNMEKYIEKCLNKEVIVE